MAIQISAVGPQARLFQCVLSLQCARSKPATDADEPLFKVAVVPIETEKTADNQATPLQQALNLPGFALIVSMNHTLGDVHTYYKLYGMLGMDTDVETLDPVRVADFEQAKTEVIGAKENAMFTSAGLGLGILGSYLGAKLTRREPQNVCIHTVDPAWAAQEKAKAKQASQVPFVSTNDALTAWFFREMKSDGIITSIWNNGIIFCPRAGELGILMITRTLNSDMLTQQKTQAGPNVPMGARIV